MSYAYRIVGGKEREQSLFFMLNALLQSRIDTGDETTDDEDVNVYLASLLHDLVDRAGAAEDHVSSYDADVARMADGKDLRKRFQVYRSNADHALVGRALFDRPWLDRGAGRTHTVRSDRLEARGSHYYAVAASIERKLKYGSSGVSEVLAKLSERFELYAGILAHVRSSHLKLFARLSRGETFHLERHAQTGAKAALIRHGRDQFLDAYGDWVASSSKTARQRVNRIGSALTKLDPDFRFDEV